jgi:hypothetical protein
VRQSRRNAFALAGVLALIASAVALVLASIGTAAGANICTSPTTSQNPFASCVGETVSPHFLTSGGKAVSLTSFKNQAVGGATATHVVMNAVFSAAVTPIGVGYSLNGASLNSNGCAFAADKKSVSCSVGNVAGGGKVVMVAEFSTTTAETVSPNVQYGEGGGNPSQVPNDNQNGKPDSLQISANGTSAGDCFATANGGSETAGSTGQSTAITVQGDGSLNLPCMPIDAGVTSKPANDPSFKTDVSFVEFPLLSTGPSQVVIKFTPLPTTLKKNFPLYELDSANGTFDIVVPPCNALPNPIPAGFDSCIFNRTALPKGGYELDLYATGTLLDNQWHG